MQHANIIHPQSHAPDYITDTLWNYYSSPSKIFANRTGKSQMPTPFCKNGIKFLTLQMCNRLRGTSVSIVQWIEQQFPKLLIRVRFPVEIQRKGDMCFPCFFPKNPLYFSPHGLW